VPRARTFLALLFVASIASAVIGTTATPASAGSNVAVGQRHRPACGQAGRGRARCNAEIVTESDGVTPATSTTYKVGLRPVDLQSAYNLPSATAGTGQTIAIIDAFDNPNAESDLNAYRSAFNLPACPGPSVGGTCFRKVNQAGDTSPLPVPNRRWGQEIAIDLDMASAVCPNCNLILVEANSSSLDDLVLAVDTAVAMGANEISNSWGAREFSTEASYESHFNVPGVAFTVSSGDTGYRVQYPASSQYVTAVGGTTLTRSSTARGWSESAWHGAGSGCSKYIAKPGWQTDTGCSTFRTVADVAAVASPSSGVAVYDSYGSSRGANWTTFGGTSVAAPIVAGVYALAGNVSPTIRASFPYSNTGALYDVTTGLNGRCRVRYLCTAGVGYDGPTGLGTPNGTGAF
jgi:subtilase family serine protease